MNEYEAKVRKLRGMRHGPLAKIVKKGYMPEKKDERSLRVGINS